MRRSPLLLAAFCSLMALLAPGCRGSGQQRADPASGPVQVGYHPTPLLGPFYAALDRGGNCIPQRFGTSGDIGYALIAGELAAGFVETEKALKLLEAPGGEALRVAGTIQFPYGATLVIRKDLNLRLADLKGKRLAALEPDCILNHQFAKDARKHGLDPRKIRYRYMPFADMLPALEAKAIDGALVKGALGVQAELSGHKILYQNWDIKGGADECCPPSVAQAEYFFVLRAQALPRLKPLLAALAASRELPPTAIREAIRAHLGYPKEALEQYATPSFEAVGEDLMNRLGAQRCIVNP